MHSSRHKSMIFDSERFIEAAEMCVSDDEVTNGVIKHGGSPDTLAVST